MAADMDMLAAASAKLELSPSEREIKIVATMGPAWESEDMLRKMISAGVDIVRLNCSHRFKDQFETLFPLIHKLSKSTGRKVEVLGDLQGPKFRTTDCRSDVIVNAGDMVALGLAVNDDDIVRNADGGVRITMHPTVEQKALITGLTLGMEVLIEDGRRRLKVKERKTETELQMQVIVGGRLKARQGVNVPDLEINVPALTAKDLADAEFLLGLDPPIDYIAMSFVQKAADIQELIDLMDRLDIPAAKRPRICPKIEKPRALTNLDGIIEKSQALMVARGDLGVEIGIERVTLAQKVMVHKAKAQGLFPVIVATQMMESMIKSAVPQRSEISDVANAVWDGADAVMLSSEAAMGGWPVETVKAQAAAALHAQKRKSYLEAPFKAPPPATAVLAPVPPPEARKTRISATIGYASQSPEMILKLAAAGVDIFRLNCAYRQPGVFEQCLQDIRSASKACGRTLEVTADLQGPKFRIGQVFWTGVQLEENYPVSIALAKSTSDICRVGGTGVRITLENTVEHAALLKAMEVGMTIYIEEGKRQIKIKQRVSESEVKGTVLIGGRLNASTAVEAPGIKIDCPALTEKDKDDVKFLMGFDPPIEYIAMSFVQSGADIQDLRDFMESLGVPAERQPKICPRIERPQALSNLEDIMAKCDGLIVARGELGFDLGLEGVPFAQKVMMHKAKSKGIFPVMVSTQLMESMIKNAVPTRAEASDVINAVFDGADVVMLSGETAKGDYPVESVIAMAACARVADAQKPLITPGFGAIPESKIATSRPVSSTSTAVERSRSPTTFSDGSLKGRIIIMMGPPASGKGTQCKLLANEYGVIHISVGDVIRDEIKRGTELGTQCNVFMSRGDMVSDELTISIVLQRLSQDDIVQNGCFLDGFPRTGPQAEMLKKSINIDRFILFQVPDDLVVSRAMGRLNDPVTGAIYHLRHNPPPTDVVGRLVRRDNDVSEEIVHTRLRFFHAELSHIVSHFEDRLFLVDGTKSIVEVTVRLKQALTQKINVQTLGERVLNSSSMAAVQSIQTAAPSPEELRQLRLQKFS